MQSGQHRSLSWHLREEQTAGSGTHMLWNLQSAAVGQQRQQQQQQVQQGWLSAAAHCLSATMCEHCRGTRVRKWHG
jgi:hypothetical protein